MIRKLVMLTAGVACLCSAFGQHSLSDRSKSQRLANERAILDRLDTLASRAGNETFARAAHCFREHARLAYPVSGTEQFRFVQQPDADDKELVVSMPLRMPEDSFFWRSSAFIETPDRYPAYVLSKALVYVPMDRDLQDAYVSVRLAHAVSDAAYWAHAGYDQRGTLAEQIQDVRSEEAEAAVLAACAGPAYCARFDTVVRKYLDLMVAAFVKDTAKPLGYYFPNKSHVVPLMALLPRYVQPERGELQTIVWRAVCFAAIDQVPHRALSDLTDMKVGFDLAVKTAARKRSKK